MNDAYEQSYALLLGQIFANLQGLEFAVRALLYAKADLPHVEMRKDKNLYEYRVGEQVPENAMTSYDSLGKLIDRYNKLAAPERKIDEGIVDLRDALAHGRLASPGSSNHFWLLKTRREPDGLVTVSFVQEMTEDWLKSQIRRTQAELQKVTGNSEIQPKG
jgi:hypothetical protein